MAFSIGSLGSFSQEQGNELVTKMVTAAKTYKYCTIYPGIKSSTKVPIVYSNIAVADQGCNIAPQNNVSGTTNLGQRTLTVVPKQIFESLCNTTLETTFYQYQMAKGKAGLEDLTFAEYVAQEKAEQGRLWIDNYFWSTFKTTLQQNSGSTVNVNSTTAITTSNAVTILDNFIINTPAQVKNQGDLILFCGLESFNTILIALKNANYYSAALDVTSQLDEINYMGVKIVWVPGLAGTGTLVMTSKKNICFPTDLLSDTDAFDVWYSKDNKSIYINADFKAGQGNALVYEFCVVKLT
jgi:hypothetical protein